MNTQVSQQQPLPLILERSTPERSTPERVTQELQVPERTAAAASAVGAAPKPSPHLLAARRLARKIRRLPDHSPEQTRTGLAICQHLRLLLAESDPADLRPSAPRH